MKDLVPKILGQKRRCTDSENSPIHDMIYYSEMIQSKNKQREKLQGNQVQASESLLPRVSHRMSLILPAMGCDMFPGLSRKTHQRHSGQSFCWGWTHRLHLPGVYKNLRLPKGKQVFGINPIVCTKSLGPVRLGGNSPKMKSKLPDSSQSLNLEAGLSKDSSLRLLLIYAATTSCLSPSQIPSLSILQTPPVSTK